MNITIVATGSRGDVQPGIALGCALRDSGHSVVVCTTEDFVEQVKLHGLEVCPIRVNMREIIESQGGIEVVESNRNPIKMLRLMSDLGKPIFAQTVTDVMTSLTNTDHILGNLASLPYLQSIAEVARVPMTTYTLSMVGPTREQPAGAAPPAPAWLPFKRIYNRMTYSALFLLWPILGGMINDMRASRLHLPPYSARSFLRTVLYGTTILHAISPAVVPRPADWADHYHMTGYWFEPEAAGWQPPLDLTHFLATSPPPIYLGFGSMTHRNPEATMTLLLEAVKQSGQRAVIASGWAGLKGVALPETIFMVEEAPHRWLFPQMAAVVHHGGAGTTAAGFRAGVPSVIVPHFIDQFFWGQRAESLGVGPKPIPRKDLTADRLASAIDQMLNDRAMRAKAATLGEVIRMEDGLSNAIKVIENQHTKLRSEA